MTHLENWNLVNIFVSFVLSIVSYPIPTISVKSEQAIRKKFLLLKLNSHICSRNQYLKRIAENYLFHYFQPSCKEPTEYSECNLLGLSPWFVSSNNRQPQLEAFLGNQTVTIKFILYSPFFYTLIMEGAVIVEMRHAGIWVIGGVQVRFQMS